MIMSLLTAAIVLGNIFAQQAPTDLGGWIALLNIGLAGVGLLAFVRGWIVPGIIHNQALEREAALKLENESLRKTIEESIIPELSRGKDLQEKMMNLTGKFLDNLEK